MYLPRGERTQGASSLSGNCTWFGLMDRDRNRVGVGVGVGVGVSVRVSARVAVRARAPRPLERGMRDGEG